MRKPSGLRGVWPAEPPAFQIKPKLKGAVLAGHRFERAVFRHVKKKFPDAKHNPWIKYQDARGVWLACPDIVVPSQRLLLECKLTWKDSAYEQIEGLYLPLVSLLYGGPAEEWRRVIVVKFWREPKREELAIPLAGLSDARPGVQVLLLPSP